MPPEWLVDTVWFSQAVPATLSPHRNRRCRFHSQRRSCRSRGVEAGLEERLASWYDSGMRPTGKKLLLKGQPNARIQKALARSVFISYAWEDDKPFVKRLHKDLTRNGFEVWWDRTSLTWDQRPFRQEIADAIRSHDRLVLVVGPKAAASPSIHQEWQWALALDKPVIPILRKGDYTLVPGELSVFQCDDFRDDAQYRVQLARIIESLRRPEPPLGALFGVPSLPSHFLARPDLLHQVKDALLADLKTPVVIIGAEARVGVHGMGGIGKSVLAAAIAHDREVRRSYPDGVVWLTIGQQPDIVRLQHDIARHLGSAEHFDTELRGRSVLRQLLAQKAVLLILDDVWQTSAAQAFDVLGPRCRALITTRDAGMLHTLGGPSVAVTLLTEEQARQLLSRAASVEPSALPLDALEVMKECGYLPLAIALCGGMAKAGHCWKEIVEALREADLEWLENRTEANQRHRTIWNAMKVSYDVLPESERRRFVELVVFTTGTIVPEAAVQTLWKHTGRINERDCTKLLISLAERSLIHLDQTTSQPGKTIERRLSLHDLVYDFATKLVREPRTLQQELLDAYRKQCPAGWHTGPNDGYFLQNLCHHLAAAEQTAELVQLLFDFNWLQAKTDKALVHELLSDYDEGLCTLPSNHPKHDTLATIQEGLRLLEPVISKDENQLAGQLIGRLGQSEAFGMVLLAKAAASWRRMPWLQPLNSNLHPPRTALLSSFYMRSGILAVAVSPDARQAILGLCDCTLKVLDLESGRELATLRGHTGAIGAIAVTPDWRRVVTGSEDGTLMLWDPKSWQALCTIAPRRTIIRAVAITSDGRRAVAGGEDHMLYVWDLESGRQLRTLKGHTRRVMALAMVPDGRRIVSGSEDNTVKVWDFETGQELQTLYGHRRGIYAVAVTPDGRRIISGSDDHTLKLWDLKSGLEMCTFRGHAGLVTTVVVAPDGRHIVSGAEDSTLKVWDLESTLLLRTLEGHADRVRAVAIMPDGKHVVSGSLDEKLNMWNLEDRRRMWQPAGHGDSAAALAVTPDGRLAVSASGSAISTDNTLKIWDIESMRELRTIRGHSREITAVAVTPDSRHAVTGCGDGTLKVWDLETGCQLRALKGHVGRICAVTVTPDGSRVVSGAGNNVAAGRNTIKVCDLRSGRELRTLQGHKGWVCAVAVSSDGRHVVSGSEDRTLRVWDLQSGCELRTFRGHTDWVTAVALTPDGSHLVSGGADRDLRVWDFESARGELVLEGHTNWVHAVAVTPNGRWVVSGSSDHTAKVWDLKKAFCLCTFTADSAVESCAVAPDSRTIVVGEQSGRIHFLRLVLPDDPIAPS